MKKLSLTLAIVLGLGLTTFADMNGGGLFNRGDDMGIGGGFRTNEPMLPNHGLDDNQNADSPVGTGIVLLTALGAAYLIGKRRREE